MDNYFRIEEFIDGNLSEEETLKFKNELVNNKDAYDDKLITFILKDFYERAKVEEKDQFKL